MFKPMRKHDQVRKLKEENDKLNRIEEDLLNSSELKVVQKQRDIFDFELHTNNSFNKDFDRELYELWEQQVQSGANTFNTARTFYQ